MAKLAEHALSLYAGEMVGISSIGPAWCGGGGRGVAGGAVARRVGEIQLIARSVVGLVGVGTQWKTTVVAAIAIAGRRALIAVYVIPVIHGQETGVNGRLGVGIVQPFVVGWHTMATTLGARGPFHREPGVVRVVGGVIGAEGDGDRLGVGGGIGPAYEVALGPRGDGQRLAGGEVLQSERTVASRRRAVICCLYADDSASDRAIGVENESLDGISHGGQGGGRAR